MATELEAVNTILRAVGTSPVTAITASSPRQVLLAQAEWQATLKRMQSVGWHWNTLRTISNDPDPVTKQIALPGTYLGVDVDPLGCDRELDVVKVSGVLFDRANDTDEFDSTLELIATIERPIDEIPQTFYEWAVAEATRRFHSATHGDPKRDRELRSDERDARAMARAEEMRTFDANALRYNKAVARRTYNNWKY